MANPHVISALIDKRARIDGEIKMRRFQITRLEMEMAHLDAVIRMFRPGYDVSKIATKQTILRSARGTVRGSGTREALKILREADSPLTTREIARLIMESRGVAPCEETCERLANNIHGSLTRRTDGAVKIDVSVYPATWSIA